MGKLSLDSIGLKQLHSSPFPFTGHLVFSPPPPHAGPALITALNILEGFNITSQVPRGNILHWMAEVGGGSIFSWIPCAARE